MFLIIDNTEDRQVAFSLLVNKKFIQEVFMFNTSSNHNFLSFLEKFLSAHDLSMKNIKGLGVVMGGEKFTAARLVTTFANTLAFSLRVPIISLAKNFSPDTAFDVLSSASAGKYVTPVYSGEARVGLPASGQRLV